MFVHSEVLIKACEERNGKRKDGSETVYRNVFIFGLAGSPADLKLGVGENVALFEKAKKFILQRAQVVMDIRTFNGVASMNLHDIQAVSSK